VSLNDITATCEEHCPLVLRFVTSTDLLVGTHPHITPVIIAKFITESVDMALAFGPHISLEVLNV